MLVALLSDIHDHTTHLLLALQTAREAGCTHLLFMGDMAGITTFRTLREEWPHPIDLVFGNNEYELQAFQRMAQQWECTHLHGEEAELELDGRKLYFSHLPWVASRAAESGKYDAVFFGHTHRAEQYCVNHTLVANPGEVYGRQSQPSLGIYNTATNEVRIVTF